MLPSLKEHTCTSKAQGAVWKGWKECKSWQTGESWQNPSFSPGDSDCSQGLTAAAIVYTGPVM